MEIATIARHAACAAGVIALTALVGCERHRDVPPGPSTPDASAVVIGTTPAPPSGDPPGTTPVASGTTEVTKKDETEKKPQEGDNHSYSTVAPDSPQKAGGKDPAQSSEERKPQ